MTLYDKCPLCGIVSALIINPTQAICSNDDCKVVTFNPSLPDGGLSNVHEVQELELEPALQPFTKCPDCGGTKFLEGPHGGLAVNFCCAKCWARFNDTIVFGIQRDGFVLKPERALFHGRYVPRR